MNNIQAHGKHKLFIYLSSLFLFFMFTNSYAALNAFDKPVNHPPIPLLDEQGNNVLGTTNPYSPKKVAQAVAVMIMTPSPKHITLKWGVMKRMITMVPSAAYRI